MHVHNYTGNEIVHVTIGLHNYEMHDEVEISETVVRRKDTCPLRTRGRISLKDEHAGVGGVAGADSGF